MEHSEHASTGAETALALYGDLLFRLCLVMLGNASDAEDAVQETILAYLQKTPAFENSDHEKAWFITTAKNKCRDLLRFRKRHPQTDLADLCETPPNAAESAILEALFALPERFRLVLTLYYVEGYRVEEIARLIGKTPSAVKMRLQKGRKLLEEHYRKEYL